MVLCSPNKIGSMRFNSKFNWREVPMILGFLLITVMRIRHVTTTPLSWFFKGIYSSMQQPFTSSPERTGVWNGGDGEGPKSFVGYFQVSCEKAAAMLKITALVAYPVHVVLKNGLVTYCHWPIEHWHTLLACLPVRFCRDLEDSRSFHKGRSSVYCFSSQMWFMPGEHSDSFPRWMHDRRTYLYHMMRWWIFWRALADAVCVGFEVDRMGRDKLGCFPIAVSYCCYIPEVKDMSIVKSAIEKMSPCEDIW